MTRTTNSGYNPNNEYIVINHRKNIRYLGFDLSTQQLKAIVINDDHEITHHVNVDFDSELPEFRTTGGANKHHDDDHRVTSPVLMWLKAIDLCMEKLKLDGLDFSQVVSISGCAQQHGSVYWKHGSQQLLASLDPSKRLYEQLGGTFTLYDTPIWMDSSTNAECKRLEQSVGGSAKLAEITGSRAYERFTGPQIAKIYKSRDLYTMTERITLVSNFFASLLCGIYTPFDVSDASGMNLMDIKQRKWSQDCLDGCGPSDLRIKLIGDDTSSSNIVDSSSIVGPISNYFVKRYKFSEYCQVVSFTGDNPGSLIGMCVNMDEVVISLGTSDTAFFWLDEAKPGLNGHVLRNPIDSGKYMGLICFKNGSKTRERIRDTCANCSWQDFSDRLNSVPRGNFGQIGFYYDLREIYPLCIGDHRFNKLNERVPTFYTPEMEIRALVEGQFMRLRHHSEMLGLKMDSITRVLVTGGASTNRSILEVISDIFNVPVYTQDIPNSACLGGAYMAKYGLMLHNNNRSNTPSISFAEVFGKAREKSLTLMAQPAISALNIYRPLMERYTLLEDQLVANNNDFVE